VFKTKILPCCRNAEYTVSSDGYVYSPSGTKLLDSSTDKYCRVRIKLNDKWTSYPVARLVLETFRPVNNYENLKIVHLDGNLKNCKLLNLVWFAQLGLPIVDEWKKDNNYVHIPGYSRYVINREGTIRVAKTTEIVPGWLHQYYMVSLKADDDVHRNCLVHRLVAMAFIPIPEKLRKLFSKLLVNHIDGNKQNCSFENLEWCTYKQNLEHALQTGLNSCIKVVYLKDIHTGKITEYLGLNRLAKKLGIDAATLSENISCDRKKILCGKYLLSCDKDSFATPVDKRAPTKAIAIVAKNLSTDEDTEYPSISAAWNDLRQCGLKKTSMKRRLRNKNLYQVPLNGYVFKRKGDRWDIKNTHKYTKKPVYVKTIGGEDIRLYNSARECSRHLGISPDIVWTFLNSDKDKYTIGNFVLLKSM
jgi:hypothetical protein